MRLILPFLPLVLPFAVKWVEQAERRILLEGKPLVEPHLSDAVLMGVQHPERIRILRVPRIPLPGNPLLHFAGRMTGLVSERTVGMALGYGIFLREDYPNDRRLIAHECVHTAQYERLGGIHAFLERYLRECLQMGYPESPLEQEAIGKSSQIHG